MQSTPLSLKQAAQLTGKTVKALNIKIDEGELLAGLNEEGKRYTTIPALQLVRLLPMGSLSEYPPNVEPFPRPAVPTKRRQVEQPQNEQRRKVNPQQAAVQRGWVAE